MQYNDKYTNVFYENKSWRLYDETKTNSLDALYSETQIKLIELIKQNNFKIFYFICEPLTKYKLFINEGQIDLDLKNVLKLKENQCEDFYYIYENQLCEVFYSFAKLDDEKNYYFDFMLVVNNNFKLNNFYNYKFKSVQIVNVKEIFLYNLTFDFIKSIFEQRIIIENNCELYDDKDFYKLESCNIQIFSKIVNKNINDINWEDYLNYSSFYLYERFNQDLYSKSCFKLLCSQIWTTDREFYIEKNNFGTRLCYFNKYNLNSSFLTNFAELSGCVSVNLDNSEKKIEQKYYTYSCLTDNFNDQCIHYIEFNKELINKNYKDLNLINFKNIEKYYN